jgi:hypothetical protein
MKKIVLVTIAFVLLVINGFAQQPGMLLFSGEVLTGLRFEEGTEIDPQLELARNDIGQRLAGRIRTNFIYMNGPFAFRWRLEADGASPGYTEDSLVNKGGFAIAANSAEKGNLFTSLTDIVKIAYAAVTLFDGQVRLVGGRIDEDYPWFILSDELNKNMNLGQSGIRAEFMPKSIPGLNFGFLLPMAVPIGAQLSPAEYLMETGYGMKYENDTIAIAAEFQLDGDKAWDWSAEWAGYANQGSTLYYWITPKFLNSKFNHFSFSMNGNLEGIPTSPGVPGLKTEDWLYFNFSNIMVADKPLNTALRLGYRYDMLIKEKEEALHYNVAMIRPAINYAITPNIVVALDAMLKFNFGQDEGDYWKYDVSKHDVYSDSALPNDRPTLEAIGMGNLRPYYGDGGGVFSMLWIEPSIEFKLAYGFSIKALYNFSIYGANAPRYDDWAMSDWTKDKYIQRAELRVSWSF